ncbi:MAG: saccharopine dehydrogenase C-terminal domain-containing protein [Chitinophagaceae bacterium]
MKKILLFGAGKSATVLIDYLITLAEKKQWNIIIADNNIEAIKNKLGTNDKVKTVAVNIEDENTRKPLIANADIVISLMPPHLHYNIALDCLTYSKHLLTASYIDKQTQDLAQQAKEKGILFLYEMGLDPGIDHMSAMQIIHKIQEQGGRITSFISHCGGLVAPESDDNPWHYKISWNPRNVVIAGKAGATFLENNEIKHIAYENLFSANNIVEIDKNDFLSFYPNRDSLGYIETYGLQGINTFIRTTLRHPEFCFGWKNIIDLKLTSEDKIYDTDGVTVKDFLTTHFGNNGYFNWLNNLLSNKAISFDYLIKKFVHKVENENAFDRGEVLDDETLVVNGDGELQFVDSNEPETEEDSIAVDHFATVQKRLSQILFLGMGSDTTLINKGLCSAADVLQFILERKLVLNKDDKDMIVMLHEIEYELDGKNKSMKSLLRVVGENNVNTAMAKTVGLPLGIAAQLILEGEINETGLHIPILPSIYQPVLNELLKYDIILKETIK